MEGTGIVTLEELYICIHGGVGSDGLLMMMMMMMMMMGKQ